MPNDHPAGSNGFRAAVPGDDSERRTNVPPARHIGVLVIHGMGEESAYGTLGTFAQGLYGCLHDRGIGYAMQAEWKERISDPEHAQQSWTQAQVHFEPARFEPAAPEPLPASPAPRITVAEYYWSPITKGKIKDIAVLTWLIRSGLEPFRYLCENLDAMFSAIRPGKTASKWDGFKRSCFVLAEEFLRLVLIFPLLIGSFIAIGVFLLHLPELASGVLSTFQHLDPRQIWIGLVIALRLLILASLAGYFLNWLNWLSYRSIHVAGEDSRRKFQVLALTGAFAIACILLLLVPKWIDPRFSYSLHGNHVTAVRSYEGGGLLEVLWRWIVYLVSWPALRLWGWFSPVASRYLLVTPPYTRLLVPLVQLGFAAGIRSFFIYFLGDVAIYTNLNQLSSNFSVRSQILEECGHALTTLYLDLQDEAVTRIRTEERGLTREQALAKVAPGEFTIVLAAHSLGTVIAYDTLNDLFNRARIGAGAPGTPEAGRPVPSAIAVCGHMRGMLTFGSPLNKTYYFFRDESAPEELVRAQIVDQLHSFRLLAPQSNLPKAPLAPPHDSDIARMVARFRWLNLWAVMDIVSGKLFFYDLPETDQICGSLWTYWKPVFAHLTYWKDKRMYELFRTQLLPETSHRSPAASTAAPEETLIA